MGPTHKGLHRWQLDEEEDHEHADERRQEQHRTESGSVSALELEDALELSLVRVGIVLERPTLEGRALGWPGLG